MKLRPVDDSGDILPVERNGDLVSGAEAVALLVRDRLELLSGDWWENPARGNGILEMLRVSRLTDADRQALATYLTSYIRGTGGVDEVSDVQFSAAGRVFDYRCTVHSAGDTAVVNYSLEGMA